jgi:hypothetical protein
MRHAAAIRIYKKIETVVRPWFDGLKWRERCLIAAIALVNDWVSGHRKTNDSKHARDSARGLVE